MEEQQRRPEPHPRAEHKVDLVDRRRIGTASYGDLDGDAVLWFHGTPGARRQVPPTINTAAAARGLRVVAVERPGVGASTRHLHGSVGDFAGDVEQVVDALELERFSVVGLSGGGPYALGCAARLGDRVRSAAVLGGVAPTQGDDAVAGGLVELAVRLRVPLGLLREQLGWSLWSTVRALAPAAQPAFAAYLWFQPPGDRALFAMEGMREMFARDLVGGTRGACHAAVYDLLLFTRHWGFALEEVRVPVRLWHGDEDPIVPLAHGHHLAERIPGADLVVRPGEGHLGSFGAVDEVLDAVRSQRRARAPVR